MSEFYKALEQAERDRLRQDQPAPTAPPAARSRQREDVPPSDVVAAKATPTRVDATTVAPAAPPVPPMPKPADATNGKAAPDAAEAPVRFPKPRGPLPVGTPSTVFRPSLQVPERRGLLRRLVGRKAVLIAHSDPSSMEADAYRTLRANIELMSDDGAYRHIAITSATGGDGKSTTAANLAVVAAQAGRRVCLVDSDLRRPTIHEIFGLSNVDGLVTALSRGIPLQAVAQPADVEGLSIVVAGRGAAEAVHDLITPERLENLLKMSDSAFDFVIFDSPPVKVADALSVAAACDGVILVVRAGSIPFAVLRRAIGQISQVKGRVLGVLLNRAELRASDADSYQYYGASPGRRSRS